MISQKLMVLFILTQLVACATSPYVQPSGDSLARITLKEKGGLKYGAFTYDNAGDCSGRKMLKNFFHKADKTFHVPGNEGRSITLVWDTGFFGAYVTSCIVTITFQPRISTAYELIPYPENDTCGIIVTELDGEEIKAVEFEMRSSIQGAFESSSFCS